MALDFENDEFIKRWLRGRNKSTVATYKQAMNAYLEFTQMTPKELIDEKLQDVQDTTKKPWEKETSEQRVRDFNIWLQTKFKKENGQIGLAPRSALVYCAAIVNFYNKHNLSLSIKLTREFGGAPKGENETEKMTAEQIEKLAYYAPTLRDKAVIWCMFQGGMDVSTLCSLNWGHIEKEILNPPVGAVMLRGLERKKELGRRFNTLIYRTATAHLRQYLEEEHGEEYWKKLKYDTPLFLGQKGERHAAYRIQQMMRKIAPDSGIAGSRQGAGDFNPLRPHALRASFSDQMAKAGASKQLIDYLMGHKLQFDTAYFGGESGLREAYVKYAEVVLEPKRAKPTQELEADLRSRIDELKTTIAEQSVLLQKTRREKELSESKIRRLEGEVELLAKRLQELPLTDAEIESNRADLFYAKFKEQEQINEELRTSLNQAIDGIKEMKAYYEKRMKKFEEKR